MRKLAVLAALVGLLAWAAPAHAQGASAAGEQYEYGAAGAAGSTMAGRDLIIDVTGRLAGEGSGAARGAGSYVSALGGGEAASASAQVPAGAPPATAGITELPDTGGVRVVLLPFGAVLLLLAARLIKRSL